MNIMQYVISFVAGIISALAFCLGTFVAYRSMLYFYPNLFDGMAIFVTFPLLFLTPIIGVIFAGTIGSLLLFKLRHEDRLSVVILGFTVAIPAIFEIMNKTTTPFNIEFLYLMALIVGIAYVLQTVLLNIPIVGRVAMSVVIAVASYWFVHSVIEMPEIRTQVQKLQNIGFTVYAPSNTRSYPVRSIGTYGTVDDEAETVIVNIDGQNSLYQVKVANHPDANCGEPFEPYMASRSEKNDPTTVYTCKRLATEDSISMYQIDTKRTISTFETQDMYRSYFAISGNTLIYTGSRIPLQVAADPVYRSNTSYIRDYENSQKSLLLNLAPVKDVTQYIEKP